MELNYIHHINVANDESRANAVMHNIFVERFLTDVDVDNYYEATRNYGEIYVREQDLIQCTICALRHGYPLEKMTDDQYYEFASDIKRCPCHCIQSIETPPTM